ncbi:hypothetical protein GGI35DRAFT_489104 [Trichoderma velutinum]
MAEPPKGYGLKTSLSHLAFSLFVFAFLSGLCAVSFMALGIEHDDTLRKLLDTHTSNSSPKSTMVTIAEHPQYKNLSRDFDHLWDELLTPNGGFIMKKDENNDVHQYGISMFHQLHCLAMIRTALQEALSLKDNMSKMQSRHEHSAQQLTDGSPHWLHCFDYLRQTILCEADSTIEPPMLNEKGQERVNGMGERQCRDWTLLWDASIKSDEEL